MEKVRKYYRGNGSRQVGYIIAIINWTPSFLQSVYHKFGLDNEFSVKDVLELFKYHSSETSIRLKFYRLYKNHWFIRKKDKETGLYLYKFSPAGINYRNMWGGFGYDGPLIYANKPEIVEKRIEVRKEIISKDRYLGEV